MITINNNLKRSSYLMNGTITVRNFLNTIKRWELTQAVQKVKSFFLACYEDFLQVTTRALGIDNYNLSERYIAKAKSININVAKKRVRINYFPFKLFSFSRQVLITQAEKLVFSFFACSSICSMSSWGKRISLRFDLLVSFAILIHKKLLVRTIYTKLKDKNSIDMCGQIKIYCADRLRFKTLINAIARSIRSTTSYLTQPLNEVMIMANRYDSAHLRAEQSKLFKFYDLSTAQVVQSIAQTEPQARKQLGKQSLIFIARIRLYSTTGSLTTLGGHNHA